MWGVAFLMVDPAFIEGSWAESVHKPKSPPIALELEGSRSRLEAALATHGFWLEESSYFAWTFDFPLTKELKADWGLPDTDDSKMSTIILLCGGVLTLSGYEYSLSWNRKRVERKTKR
jgi:hypothetical protein